MTVTTNRKNSARTRVFQQSHMLLSNDRDSGFAGCPRVPRLLSQACKFWESFIHVVEKCLELAGARGLAQLAQGLGFDLANALAGNGERAANLLQRMLRAILQTKAHPHDLLLARGQGAQHVRGLFLRSTLM